MEMYSKSIAELLKQVKAEKPLIHQITNYVTVNDCANIVLALGGSPVMADDWEEVEEMVSLASALVINIGTLNSRTVTSMLKAGKKANDLGLPVVLDPVGIGATGLRTETAQKIIREVRLSVIRGNMSEIKVLAGGSGKTRGVDSTEGHQEGKEVASGLARKLDCIVAITGAQDTISDGVKTILVKNGDPLLARVTGTGCMATALVGTYCGVASDYFLGTVAGIVSMGLAGENAARDIGDGAGIGTYKVKLFDQIFRLTPQELAEGAKIHEG